MALEQDRIRDLDTYTGTEPTSNVYVPLDSSAFGSKPFKMPITDLLSNNHTESGRLVGLLTGNVSITFSTAFSATPLTVTLRVYRMDEYNGKYIMTDVLHTFSSKNWVTTTGFSLAIDSTDAIGLIDIIVEYCFMEL